MKRLYTLCLALMTLMTGQTAFVSAQNNVNSDHWTATDALGRTLGRYDDLGKGRKEVLMFYWTWHEREDMVDARIKNNTEILQNHPEAALDAEHPAWANGVTGYYFWDEPLLGYYRTTDKWVLRKHAELLADAKVDAVFFDCTNGSLTWDASTDSLLEVWSLAQSEGVNVPRIGFMLPFGYSDWSLTSLRHLYKRLYQPGKYRSLWYMRDGKPCIMAYPNNLKADDPVDRAIADFFTFRPAQPDYVDGPNPAFPHQWGWLENYPQHGYNRLADGSFELVTVGVSQNACPETKGHCSAFNKPGAFTRSFSQRKGYDPRKDGYLYGWNFSEQWDRAYELDPQAVFITGWNEWIAGKYSPKDSPWTGEPYSFVDEYDADHSRDIEPVKSWGDKGDVYYMQLIDRVRRFKGTTQQASPTPPRTLRLGDWASWQTVQPVYTAYKGNTRHRNSLGSCGIRYVNNSGRNDLVEARVTRDARHLYFYVRTDQKLTSPTDANWMILFIDIDRNKTTGWQGYDFIVNYRSPNTKKKSVYIQRSYQNKWIWKDAGIGSYALRDNELVLRLPREALGLTPDQPLDFEFKWSDNMQDEGNIMDFYVNGDAAPGGRFNYVYTEQER